MKLLKTTLLITLLSLSTLSHAQDDSETVIAIKSDSVWIMTEDFPNLINHLLPASSVLYFTTATVDPTNQLIQLTGYTSDSNQIVSERILGHIIGNKMYTQTDIYTSTHYMECVTTACCIICRKTVTGTCDCYTNICSSGTCDKRTFGAGDIPAGGISNAVRNYLN